MASAEYALVLSGFESRVWPLFLDKWRRRVTATTADHSHGAKTQRKVMRVKRRSNSGSVSSSDASAPSSPQSRASPKPLTLASPSLQVSEEDGFMVVQMQQQQQLEVRHAAVQTSPLPTPLNADESMQG